MMRGRARARLGGLAVAVGWVGVLCWSGCTEPSAGPGPGPAPPVIGAGAEEFDAEEVTTTDAFDATLAAAGKPVLVAFYAPGCSHCAVFAVTFNRVLADEGGRVMAIKVNARRIEQIRRRYQVVATPTTILLADGKEAKRWYGEVEEARFRRELNAALEE